MTIAAPDLAALIIRTIKRALEPLAVRLAGAEARLAGLEPVLERLAATEARLAIAEAGTLRQAAALEAAGGRLGALEAQPGLGPLREALAAVGARVEGLAPALEALAVVREHVAALEARPLVPGPPGPAGADGLGFDDLAVEADGGHAVTLRFAAGDRVKTFPLVLPFLRDCGVYLEGSSYTPGDAVTWGGSLWVCQAATTGRPGLVATAAAWRLAVKCGRDGKDGKPGDRGPAGPAGKDWQQVYDGMRGR